MSTHRVTRTQPIERVSLRPPTVDHIGSAWSTSCAICSVKVSRVEVKQINLRLFSTGRSGLNVCAPCKGKHDARKAAAA